MHGDNRNDATALITAAPEALEHWGRVRGLTTTSDASLVHVYVRTCIEELNGRLNGRETIKDFRILDHDLTIEDGDLTPSMKVKRNTLEARYGSLLDSMYDGALHG